MFALLKIGKVGVHRKVGAVSLNDIVALLKQDPRIGNVGAIVTFTGIVKTSTMGKKAQTQLEVALTPETVQKTLEKIVEETEKKDIIAGVSIHFNYGILQAPGDILHIAMAGTQGPERVPEFFNILVEVLNRVKRETEIRFKEHTPDGAEFYKPPDSSKSFD